MTNENKTTEQTINLANGLVTLLTRRDAVFFRWAKQVKLNELTDKLKIGGITDD